MSKGDPDHDRHATRDLAPGTPRHLRGDVVRRCAERSDRGAHRRRAGCCAFRSRTRRTCSGTPRPRASPGQDDPRSGVVDVRRGLGTGSRARRAWRGGPRRPTASGGAMMAEIRLPSRPIGGAEPWSSRTGSPTTARPMGLAGSDGSASSRRGACDVQPTLAKARLANRTFAICSGIGPVSAESVWLDGTRGTCSGSTSSDPGSTCRRRWTGSRWRSGRRGRSPHRSSAQPPRNALAGTHAPTRDRSTASGYDRGTACGRGERCRRPRRGGRACRRRSGERPV